MEANVQAPENERQSTTSSSPASRSEPCPACKGLRVLARPSYYIGQLATVYPLHTRADAVIIPCPKCGVAEHKAQIAQHSGLKPREQKYLLRHWQVFKIEDHSGWTAQRRAAKELMQQAIKERAGFFTFSGDFGAGKSMALQIVINELRETLGVDGYYTLSAGVLDHIRSLIGAKQDSSGFWERLLHIPALALDEVDRFRETDWAREKLFVLIDERYRQRDTHLTLFAMNSDPGENLSTEETIGYLYSRIREGKQCVLQGDMREYVGGE